MIALWLFHWSRFTDTIKMNARLASEIFLSSLQTEFFSKLLV